MPLLAAFLASLMGFLVDFFVVYFTRTVALKLAFAAMIVTAFGVLAGAMAGAVALISMGLPSLLVAIFAFAFPSNIIPCAAAVIACDASVAGFRLFIAGVNS